MKTTLQVFLVVVLVIILVVALVGGAITFFVAWTFGGVRFSPEDAAGYGYRDATSFTADEYYFFYKTLENDSGVWITEVLPVQKSMFMYSGMYHCPKYTLTVEGTDAWAGNLLVVEGKTGYHNFYLAPVDSENPEVRAFVEAGYDSVTVDGKEIPLYMHSYFVTETEITTITVNGVTLTVPE